MLNTSSSKKSPLLLIAIIIVIFGIGGSIALFIRNSGTNQPNPVSPVTEQTAQTQNENPAPAPAPTATSTPTPTATNTDNTSLVVLGTSPDHRFVLRGAQICVGDHEFKIDPPTTAKTDAGAEYTTYDMYHPVAGADADFGSVVIQTMAQFKANRFNISTYQEVFRTNDYIVSAYTSDAELPAGCHVTVTKP